MTSDSPESPQEPAQPAPEGPGDEAAGSSEAGEAAEQPADQAPGSASEAPETPAAPGAKPRKAEVDPDEELLYTAHELPSADELRAAMGWAFEKEDAPSELLDAYALHAGMVLAGNREMNLSSIVDPREVAAKHYLESWRATRLIPLMGRSLLDLGTGAGFPGLPVALAEDMARVHLVDFVPKRIEFLERCIAELGIKNASAECIRAEEYLARHEVDIVLVRAVSSVRENVRLLRKVRHSHKDLVMLRGPSWSREARAGEREAERLGFRLDTVWEHELPEGMGKRAILVYRAPGGAGS